MNDSKEICLYFDKNTNYNPVDIAKEICDRYKELGNPLILPSQGGNAPIIVFQENPEIFLRCNYFTLNFVVNHTYFNKLESIIFDLVDIFEEYKVKFVRIGYVNNLYYDKDKIEKARLLYLNDKISSDMEEYQVYLYKQLETKYGMINAWERVISEGNKKHELLMQYDFNSKQEDSIDFNMKYIKEFIKVSNEYIESRSNI